MPPPYSTQVFAYPSESVSAISSERWKRLGERLITSVWVAAAVLTLPLAVPSVEASPIASPLIGAEVVVPVAVPSVDDSPIASPLIEVFPVVVVPLAVPSVEASPMASPNTDELLVVPFAVPSVDDSPTASPDTDELLVLTEPWAEEDEVEDAEPCVACALTVPCAVDVEVAEADT